MNHHADKLVEVVDPKQTGQIDPVFGGLIHETHGCPNCGNIEFRQAN
jgi:hypothetical protein